MLLRRLAMLSLALLFSAALTLADDKVKEDKTKAKSTIEPTHISVYRKIDEKNFGPSGDNTRIEIFVALPGKHLLGVDRSSKVTTFADDKGNSLIRETDFFKPNFASYPRLGKDRTSMIVSLYSNHAPKRGATKVLVKGELVAVVGLDEKSTEETKVEFKLKNEVKIGDFKLKVIQEKGFGDSGAYFAVESKFRGIKRLTVLGDDGKEVQLYDQGLPNFFNKTWTHHYTLRKVLKAGKVKITYFSKEEMIKLPVDLAFGVGL